MGVYRQLTALVLVAACASVVACGTVWADDYTGRVLVSFALPGAFPGAPLGAIRARAAAVRAVLARAGARPSGPSVPQIGLVTVRPAGAMSFAALSRRLLSDRSIRAVQRERRFRLRYLPNDPALTAAETSTGSPPGLAVQWWVPREDLPRAWDITRGNGSLVGVIDTGVDGGHPELAGKIAGTAAFDAYPTDGPATTDEVGHGTHVASIACAASDNAIGLTGAGFDCRLRIEKSDLSDASVAAAIVDATDHGVDAINMSFGTSGQDPPSQVIVDAINYAYGHNVVMVAAAADSAVSEQGDPANVLQPTGTGPLPGRGVGLTVTAANYQDRRAGFAGYGTQISLAAYGAFSDYVSPATSSGPPGIFGAFPAGLTQIETGLTGGQSPCPTCRHSFQGDNRYAYLQGTSMAAPMVTAVAAMMRHLNHEMKASEVIGLIKATARRPAGSGWNQDLGWGILDAGAAIDAARHVDHQAPVSALTAPMRSHSPRLHLRWSGSDPAPEGLIASGIDRYELWRVLNGRAVRIAVTRNTSITVNERRNRLYGFYTLAIDHAGNRQARPRRYAQTRVLSR